MIRSVSVFILSCFVLSCTHPPAPAADSAANAPRAEEAGLFSTSSSVSNQEYLLEEAVKLLNGMIHAPHRTVNQEMLGHAKGIALFPLVVEEEYTSKAAFGNGVVSLRSPDTGEWGPPVFHKLMGVTFGQWAGLTAWDMVFVVVSDKGRTALTRPAYQFGQEISTAYGPMEMHAKTVRPYLSKRDLYVYSRAQGAFVGISPGGGMINNLEGFNKSLYGGAYTPQDILLQEKDIPLPPAAKKFMQELNRLAPKASDKNAT